MRMRVPLLCLVTYRGFAKLQGTHLNPAAPAENAELLGRPDVDSVALLTEPTLRAWNIPYDFLHDHGDVSKIPRAFQQAQELRQPVALLLTV
jgi:hypothetical protein